MIVRCAGLIAVTVVVIGVTVRDGFLEERDLLDGDVRSRSPCPRRDRLSKHHGQHQGAHRCGSPQTTAYGPPRRATQAYDYPSSRATLARTA